MQEYLQRERLGSARLENFASALELIGQKVSLTNHEALFSVFHLVANFPVKKEQIT